MIESPRRLNRRWRLACLTSILAFGALLMWTIVWKRVQEMRIVTWVAAVNKLGVDAEVTDDPWDSSLLGRMRDQMKLPTVQVYVWGQPEAELLLKAPDGHPRPLLLHINKRVTDAARQRLADRFPGAELRADVPAPSATGGGFF